MTFTIDPEVREILDDVLSDPESTLGRVPERGFGGWLRTEQALSSTEPWLTKAERHLARVHRESAAFLLYQACQAASIAPQSIPIFLCRRVTPRVEVRIMDDGAAWAMRAQNEVSIEQYRGSDEIGLLTQYLTAKELVSASQLAVMSLRLVPRDETRIWLGLALLSEGRYSAARLCFREVAFGNGKPLNRALAWVNLGFTALRGEQYSSAWSNYEAAAHVDGDMHIALSGLMYSSLLVGDRPTFWRSACAFADVLFGEHTAIHECRNAIAGIATTLASPTASAKAMVNERWDRMPATAQLVLEPVREAQT